MNRALANFLNLIYPPVCLHCKGWCEEADRPFCESCRELLCLVNPLSRCNHCFRELGEEKVGKCKNCRDNRKNIPLLALAAALEYQGPAGALIRQIKYRGHLSLVGGAGAFMAAQWSRLSWPAPDLIVPVPTTLAKRLVRGYNTAFLLGCELGSYLSTSCHELIRRKMGGVSQSGLSHHERLKLTGEYFSFAGRNLEGVETILLVDDVMTTGTTLLRCAETILEKHPCRIYALTFAHSSG